MQSFLVKSFLILDNDGNRIVSRYYDQSVGDVAHQKAFEMSLMKKMRKQSAFFLHEGFLVMFANWGDCYVVMCVSEDQHELLLESVFQTATETLGAVLGGQTSKVAVTNNFDYVLIALDELLDDGLILQLDSSAILDQLKMKGAESEVPITEQSVSHVWSVAKDQFAQFLRG